MDNRMDHDDPLGDYPEGELIEKLHPALKDVGRMKLLLKTNGYDEVEDETA